MAESSPSSLQQSAALPKNGGLGAIHAASALAVVLAYATFSGLWILLSDRLLGLLFSDPITITLISTLKGWLFVAVTSLLLYALMRRMLGRELRSAGRAGFSNLPFILLTVALTVVTGVGISHTLLNQRGESQDRLQAIAAMKERQLSDWLRERQGDAEFVLSSHFLADQFERGYLHHDQHALIALETRLEQLRTARNFQAISLVAADGKLVWSSDQGNILALPEVAAAIHRAQSHDQPERVGPLQDDADESQLIWVIPLQAAKQPRPLVLLHAAPSLWLYPALQTWPTASNTAETLMLRRMGDRALILNTPRHGTSRPGHVQITALQNEGLLSTWLNNPAPIISAQAPPQTLTMSGRDYRGESTVAALRTVPGTDWALLVKQDSAEVYEGAIVDASWIGLSGILAALMAAAGFFLLRQRQDLLLSLQVRESQAERLRTLKLHHAIFESSSDAIFAKDAQGRYLVANAETARVMGLPADQITGHTDLELFPAPVGQEIMAWDREIMRRDQIHTCQEVLELPEGRRIFFTTKGPLHDEDGQIIGLFGIARDITENLNIANALKVSEARYRQLLDSAIDAVFVASADGHINYVNPQAAQLMACTRGDLLERHLA